MNRRIKQRKSGGGFPAIYYVWKTSRRAGGVRKMWNALRTKNTCKTCALGMGGQRGGMVNERGGWPEVCKKSVQAMAADMQPGIGAEFWKTYSVPQLQKFSPLALENCGRLRCPVVLEPKTQYYRETTWDEAIERISAKMRAANPQESFFYFSGRSSNEAGFLLQLFARSFGTNHVNNCSYYCHQASGVGLTSVLGSGTATVELDDLEQADLIFLIGGNPASNHPRLMTSLMKIRRRGGRVVVINPVVEAGLVRFRVPSDPCSLLFGSQIASTYIQPHIGGDLALLTGIAKQLVANDAHDLEFLRSHCDSAQEWLDWLDKLAWSEIERQSGVNQQAIQELAEIYAQSDRTIFAWTMGITHHSHGVQNVQAIANLALARGMVGKPGCGLLPIRGHSNVQGMGSMGVTPALKQAVIENLKDQLDVRVPTAKGLDTLGCMEASHRDEMRFAICLGGNLLGSNPDTQFASESLSKVDCLVYLNTTLNTGHALGVGKETWILPVLARDEESQSTTQESMFNFVRLSDGGSERIEGPKREIDIVVGLAERVLDSKHPIDWKRFRSNRDIRKAISEAIPGMSSIGEIDETKSEFTIANRVFHSPSFPTENGKAKIHRFPQLNGESDRSEEDSSIRHNSLRLMTVRSEGQFNTVVYEDVDLYRGQERRDVILMNQEDLSALGIGDDEPVVITSCAGKMKDIIARRFDSIRAGNALMYFPEANVLVPRRSDPSSRTPAFKNININVTPMSAINHQAD